MKGPLLLIGYSLRRIRALAIAMAVLLGGFQVLLVALANSVHQSKAFAGIGDLLPPFVREFLGPSVTAFLTFGGMVCQGYFHPIVITTVIALTIVISTMPTSEIESGFMDFILSRPIARHWMITRTIVVTAICTAGVVAMMTAGTWAALHAFGPEPGVWPPAALIWSLAINLGLLMLCWSGVAMAIGAAARRRGVAGAITGLLALATFLLDFVARTWPPARAAARLSPFYYSNPLELIMGIPLRTTDLLALAGIAVAGFATAYVVFSRRDLSR
jgi:ABC-2 type transport system permease protein